MQNLILTLQLFLFISFITYGSKCIFSEQSVLDFKKFKMSHLRIPVGIAQIILSIILLMSIYISWLTPLGSLGLTVMMAIAVITRIKVKDSFRDTLPSVIYFLLSLTLFGSSVLYFN